MIILVMIIMLVTSYMVYFTDKGEDNLTKILHALGTIYLIYYLYGSVRKFIKNEPVIIMSKDEIALSEANNFLKIKWSEIKNWKIEKGSDEAGTPYLIIEAVETTKKMNIGWLDKKPEAIAILLGEYLKK